MEEDYNLGVIFGDNGVEMTIKILEEYKLAEKLPKAMDTVVGIKPNLVLASPAEKGATTDPDIVEGIIKYLKEKNINNIEILESSWVGCTTEKAFEVCGYRNLSKKWDVDLIDLKKDSYQEYEIEGETLKICDRVMEVDYLINVPVLKAHCQTRMTCALKNMKGCIPDSEKRRYHTMGLHKPIALLNKIVETDLVIVDGIYGDLTFEEGGNPVKMNRIIFGEKPVLVDLYAARLLGLRYEDIGYLNYFHDRLLDQPVIKSLNTPGEVTLDENLKLSSKAKKLSRHIKSDSACSACYGNLIHALHRLNEQNKLSKLEESVFIGQGYRNINIDGIGIGRCTENAGIFVEGCPPETDKIIEFLSHNLN